MRCDFCSDHNVTARYKAEDFIVESFTPKQFPLQQGSLGDWAACVECERLIDAGKWEELVKRVSRKFFAKFPILSKSINIEDLEEQYTEMYRQMRTNNFRKGKLFETET